VKYAARRPQEQQWTCSRKTCITSSHDTITYCGKASRFSGIKVVQDRALKSREISHENTGIFAHMWHQCSLLGVNQSRPLTLKDYWWSKAN